MQSIEFIENNRLEFKSSLPSGPHFAKTVVAFANSHRGGKIVIGVDSKKKKVVGVDNVEHVEEKIANYINDLCAPFIPYEIEYASKDEKQLLIVNIEAGPQKPYYLKREGKIKGAYIRVGSTTRPTDEEVLANLLREGKHISYDSEPISRRIDLDKQRIVEYFNRREERLGATVPRIKSDLLEDLGIQKGDRATIAGALLFASHPQSLPELGWATIKAARFKGRAKGFFIDMGEFDGPLAQQIDQAVAFVLRNVRMGGRIEGTKRVETFEYPPDIVRELITNAVVHRDYTLGSSIQLAIYDDRIEVISPGSLPRGVTPENIFDRQISRNPIIARRLFEMSYIDEWGQGIDKIFHWAETQGFPRPEMDDSEIQFAITAFGPGERFAGKISGDNLEISDTDKNIFNEVRNLIIKEGSITNRKLRETFKVDKNRARNVIKNLLKNDEIEQVGLGRSTHYRIK